MDGMRTTACRATPKTAECMSPQVFGFYLNQILNINCQGFTFAGPPVTTFENYNWVTDASAMATPDDNCLVLVFDNNNTPKVDVKG